MQLVGGVNATALIFAGVGPVLWIVYAWLVAREVELAARARRRRCARACSRSSTSLWWIAGLAMQGAYGLDILKYTETVEAVARTSTPNEILRGLGYWFFYGQDRLGPWIEAARDYTQRRSSSLAGYRLVVARVARARDSCAGGTASSSSCCSSSASSSPSARTRTTSPTPLGAVFKAFATGSTAGLALRSTGRAVPLVVLALAVLLGVGTNAVSERLRRRGRARARARSCLRSSSCSSSSTSRRCSTGRSTARTSSDREAIPQYWTQAIAALDAGDHQTRILEVPGADFASYRWGNTVDPITPGLIDRPYVARELIPCGTPGTADLLNALDRRVQEGVADPDGLVAALAAHGRRRRASPATTSSTSATTSCARPSSLACWRRRRASVRRRATAPRRSSPDRRP